MDSPSLQKVHSSLERRVQPIARAVWERLREQLQVMFLSDTHVTHKIFLMSYYLDPVFRFSLRVLQVCRVECGLSTNDEEFLLKKAQFYVRSEMREPHAEDLVAQSPAKRQKIDNRPNPKMEQAWARERNFKAGTSVLDDQLDKYEAVTLPIEASALEWWSGTGKSLCCLVLPVARRVLAMQAT